MSKSLETLRNRVNALIESKAIRKVDILKKAGMSPSQLDRYLSGKAIPGLDALDRLAAAIGMSSADLISPREIEPDPFKVALCDLTEEQRLIIEKTMNEFLKKKTKIKRGA